VRRIPGHPFQGRDAPQEAFSHLARYHGLDRAVASNRLHKIKEKANLAPTDDVVIGRTGDVYDSRTGDSIGTLTDPGLGLER